MEGNVVKGFQGTAEVQLLFCVTWTQILTEKT